MMLAALTASQRRRKRLDAEPGEWQEETNRFGGVRRFRMIGGIKEYECSVRTTNGTKPQSDDGKEKT